MCEISKEGLKVDWFKDNKRIRSDDDHELISTGKSHKLVIKKVNISDIGTYKVEYKDLSTSAKLTIEGNL